MAKKTKPTEEKKETKPKKVVAREEKPKKEKKEKKEELIEVSVKGEKPVLDRHTKFVLWEGEKREVLSTVAGVCDETKGHGIAVVCENDLKKIFTIFI